MLSFRRTCNCPGSWNLGLSPGNEGNKKAVLNWEVGHRMRKPEKQYSAPAQEYLAPSTHSGGQVSEKGCWDPLWCVITIAAVQAEIKDQIKFQAAGTSI